MDIDLNLFTGFDYDGINYIAVLVVTAAGFMLGGLWYGPLFAKAWMQEVGKTEADLKHGGAAPFVISFITAFVTAHVLAVLIATMNISTLGDGIVLGLYAGIGFIATGMGSDMAFRGDSVKLWMIQSGYRIAYSVIMGGVLAVWH